MRRCAAAILVLTLSSGAALAQSDERAAPGASGAAVTGGGAMFKGTPEEQAACRSDSTRFCLDDMPDNFRVLACLQKNRDKLRKACQKVLDAHGQ